MDTREMNDMVSDQPILLFDADVGSSAAGPDDVYGNMTMPMTAPERTQMTYVKTAVLSIMFFLSVVGNSATLAQLYRTRRRKSTINLLIFHLATADILVAFFCDVTEAVWMMTVQWYTGNVTCKLVKFAQVFALYLSTYIIVIISIDRCSAILDPLRRRQTPRRVRLMIAGAWIASAIFSLPQAYIFRVERGPFEVEFHQCVTYGAYTAPWQEQLYGILSLLLMFLLPLVIIIIAYLLIFCTIVHKADELRDDCEESSWRSTSTVSASTPSCHLSVSLAGGGAGGAGGAEGVRGGGGGSGSGTVRGRLFRRAKSKSLRMTLLIVLAFIVCWTPYEVVLLLHLLPEGVIEVDERYTSWIFFFGMSNALVNPLIYGACQISQTTRRQRYR